MNNLLKYLSVEEFTYIKNENDLYLKSKILVEILFKEKKDKSNLPYINHLLRVSSNMTTLEGKVSGLLHDLVEDIEGITFEDLIDIGIPSDVIEVLKLVTKKKHKCISKLEKLNLYNKEIDNIINSNNKLAIELKYFDMSDNYNEDRLKILDKEKQDWFKLKYKENIKKLERVKKYDRY